MPQRHVIRRQIVELTVADAATARRVTPLVSDLIASRVTQLLEQLFDTAAAPDETRRIDRLELDLGALDLRALADQLPVRLEAALPAALARAGVPDHAAHRKKGAGASNPGSVFQCLPITGWRGRTAGLRATGPPAGWWRQERP